MKVPGQRRGGFTKVMGHLKKSKSNVRLVKATKQFQGNFNMGEKMKIPEFTSTQEALCWGMANYGDKEVIDELYELKQYAKVEFIQAKDVKSFFKLAFKRQFLREAWETATGKLPVKDLQYTFPEVLFFDFD